MSQVVAVADWSNSYTIVGSAAGALFVYVLWLVRKARQQDVYQPDLEDRVWHFWLPGIAYLGIAAGGAWSWSSPEGARYLVAAGMLVLLLVGIHNAWDSAIFNLASRAEP